jgi:uncharacterized protein YggE
MSRPIQVFFLLGAGVFFTGLVSAQTIQINRENKTIAISASDEATATADIAAITVGLEAFAPDSSSAYEMGRKFSQNILAALRKAGVKDEDIESAQQSLQRNTQFDDKATADERTQKQFVFQQSWTVSVSPKFAPEVIRIAVAAGANKSGEIDWRLSTQKALQAKAAENALIKARGIADNMAEGLHVKLGALIYASNETPNTKIYFARPKQESIMLTDTAEVGATEGLLPALELRPQTIREEATVYAVFAIE